MIFADYWFSAPDEEAGQDAWDNYALSVEQTDQRRLEIIRPFRLYPSEIFGVDTTTHLS